MTECFCIAGHEVFCKYKPVLDKIKEIVETDLKVKVIQNGGNYPMIYYADYNNKIQKPILDLMKEIEV